MTEAFYANSDDVTIRELKGFLAGITLPRNGSVYRRLGARGSQLEQPFRATEAFGANSEAKPCPTQTGRNSIRNGGNRRVKKKETGNSFQWQAPLCRVQPETGQQPVNCSTAGSTVLRATRDGTIDSARSNMYFSTTLAWRPSPVPEQYRQA